MTPTYQQLLDHPTAKAVQVLDAGNHVFLVLTTSNKWFLYTPKGKWQECNLAEAKDHCDTFYFPNAWESMLAKDTHEEQV